MTHEAENWLDMAKTDLGVARHLMQSYHPLPLEIICYHCQQSAEKAVKALIVNMGAEGGMPKLHDISFLLNQIKNKINIDDKYYDYADALTPYGVSARYPNELFLEERHAKEAIEYASFILEWAEEMMKK